MTNEKECAVSYSVSGYTRADGTEVSCYTRTCGAAHNSNSSNNITSEINSKKELSGNEKMQYVANLFKRIITPVG